MDGALLSRFPHLSWLTVRVDGLDTRKPTVHHAVACCHALYLEVTAQQPHDVRWITRGREMRWTSTVGTFHFVPADDEAQTYVTRAAFCGDVLLLPRRHVHDYLASEHLDHGFDYHHILLQGDDRIQRCMRRVCEAIGRRDAGLDDRAEEAARGLLLRLAELCGAAQPDWRDDTSVFDRRTLGHLVEYVDEHVKLSPSLEDMGLRTGLSPSHFARKFRQTTGLSLHRFVNRRRILRSLDMLKNRSRPLAAVALDVGFSSQSHFTRLFSMLTGMTPAKYRRTFRPTVG